tara:strand:- start:1573 stop:2022 length:450 start_codon:yes stop_codon:yes gene_type:complete
MRWLVVEHYCYLRDSANELLQLGKISTEVRNRIALAAYDKYQSYVRMNSEAAESFAWHYAYDVLEGERLIGTITGDGHLFSNPDRMLLGCVGQAADGQMQLTCHANFTRVVIGTVKGLIIERPDGNPWRIALGSSPPVKRWAAVAGPTD